MDLPGMTWEQLILSQLNHRLGEGFVDFGAEPRRPQRSTGAVR